MKILLILKIQYIMVLKKNKKVFVFCLTLLFLISCKGKNEEQNENEIITNSELKKNEWFESIDSIYTYSIKNKKCIDSISLYFMKVNTPSVIATSKYIFWKDNKAVKHGEFNLFIQVSNSQFLIISNGRRNLILNEIEINTSTINESRKILLDLNNDDSLKDPCNEISNVEKEVLNQNIILKIEIFQSCFDEYSYKELNYPFP